MILKQRGPPPWDLTASVLVAASALALFLFSPQPVTSSVEPFLFVLVLLLPGYLLSIALFPRRYDLAGKGRLVVSIGADILLALLLSLGLSLSPWGLHISSLEASAAAISLVLAAIAYFNRSALPRWNRFVPFISGSGRSHPVRKQEAGISRRMIVALFVLAAAIVLSALAYTNMNMEDIEENGEAHFTEFYIQGEKDKDRPIPVTAGRASATVTGIINHEFHAVNYTLRLAQNGSILFQKDIMLDHNQSWEEAVDYILKDPGSWQRLDFLLYKENDFTMPYSEDYLWFNVSGANLTSENSSETSEDGTVALQQVKRVVALGVDEDSSSDKKRDSDSGKATPQVASQAASKPQGGDEPEQFSLQEMEAELAETSEGNNEGAKASPENVSKDTATTSSSRKVEGSSEISMPESDITESDIIESEISESREKLVATAIALETDDLKTDNSKVDSPEVDNSEVDNLKTSDSSIASEESNSLSDTSEAKEPAEDDTESGTSQTDQEAAKQDGDDKKDAPDTSSASSEQSVSQEVEASKTSEMDSEIDSWVSTRGFSKSDNSQAFKSRNIQYVKKGDTGESAVLGSQSKTPVRLGR